MTFGSCWLLTEWVSHLSLKAVGGVISPPGGFKRRVTRREVSSAFTPPSLVPLPHSPPRDRALVRSSARAPKRHCNPPVPWPAKPVAGEARAAPRRVLSSCLPP